MRLIIAGSRDLLGQDTARLRQVVEDAVQAWCRQYDAEFTEVVSGHSGNVDLIGEELARWYRVPVKLFPYPSAERCRELGLDIRAGGPYRNEQMAIYAAGPRHNGMSTGGLVTLWAQPSAGTQSMRSIGARYGLLALHRDVVP